VTATTNDLVLAELRERINELESNIKNKEARDYLLDLAKKFLGDALGYNHTGRDAETQSAMWVVRSHVENAEKMLGRYGPNLQIVGGGTAASG